MQNIFFDISIFISYENLSEPYCGFRSILLNIVSSTVYCNHIHLSQFHNHAQQLKVKNSGGPLDNQTWHIRTADHNKSLVFILIQLRFGQRSSLPFYLQSMIVQWPARICRCQLLRMIVKLAYWDHVHFNHPQPTVSRYSVDSIDRRSIDSRSTYRPTLGKLQHSTDILPHYRYLTDT